MKEKRHAHSRIKASVAALMALFTILSTGCSGVLPSSGDTTAQENKSNIKKDIDISAIKLDGEGKLYSQLDSTEKKVYRALCDTVADGKLTHTFSDIDTDGYNEALSLAVSALTHEHPEYFWLDGGYSCVTSRTEGSSTGNVEVTLSCHKYWENTTMAQKYIDQLSDAVMEIAKEASTYPSDYEKILYVHDTIIESTTYNHEAAKSASDGKESVDQSHSAYGALVNKSAVCDGYSKAFQLILSRLDIECLYITGYGAKEPHGWNCVNIDGDYYYIDLTWDDPGYSNTSQASEGEAVHTYFAMSAKQLQKTHTFEYDFTLPECTSDRYYYYKHMGLMLDSYSFADFKQAVEKQQSNKIINVAFSTLAAYRSAKQDIIDGKRFSEIDVFSSSIRYSTDDNYYILTFYLD